ncbi:DUF427 domain-containing protein [Maricaulis sp.]|uniref:DUF427 domain-containing protein n=1 Tax=Maricaulis sp. TaxID=1486257 RepID=UPI00260C7B24|nr:DUF427 domain-containing protein [Maricaulis sp.]
MIKLPDKAALLRQAQPGRAHWPARPADLTPEPAAPGEESVWDYPRPPVIRPAGASVRIEFGGEIIAHSDRAVKVCETAGAPVYYIPPDDIAMEFMEPRSHAISVCEWKGAAIYYDIVAGGRRAHEAAFSYPDPFDDLDEGYAAIAGWLGFYAGRVDAAWLGEERARPQDGGLYAGWVTSNIKGPIKGGPGTGHW